MIRQNRTLNRLFGRNEKNIAGGYTKVLLLDFAFLIVQKNADLFPALDHIG